MEMISRQMISGMPYYSGRSCKGQGYIPAADVKYNQQN